METRMEKYKHFREQMKQEPKKEIVFENGHKLVNEEILKELSRKINKVRPNEK